MADNLLDKASILLTPTAYDNGSMLSIKPESGNGDFDFQRNSAATRVNAQGLVENVQIISSELVSNGNFSQIGTEEVLNGNFSQEGSELVTNGDFATDSDWNKDANWSIANGVATSTGTGRMFQSIQFLEANIGTIVKVSFDITDNSSGGVVVNCYGGVSQLFTGVGTHTFTTTTTNATNLYFNNAGAGSNFVGSIDNVSVKEVGQDWSLVGDFEVNNQEAYITNASQYSQLTNQIGVNYLLSGKTYKLTADIETLSISGALAYRYSGGAIQRIYTTDIIDGKFTAYFTMPQDGYFWFQTTANYTGLNAAITNISVKEVGQDWTLGTGWSVDQANSRADATDAAFNSQLANSAAIVASKKYKISFDISNYVKGSVIVKIGNTSSATVSNNGSFTFTLTSANTSSFQIATWAGSGTTLSVSNISVKEITDDTNLPRINYEGFSYQDALGSEEIVNGDFSNGSANWIFNNSGGTFGWRIENDRAICDSNASTPNRNLNSTFSLVNGKSYKLTLDILQSEDNMQIVIGSTALSQTLPTGTNLNYEYIITPSMHSGGAFGLYGGSSDLQEIDNVSVKEYLGQEVVPDSGCGSWLLEPQSTNLITQSELFTDSSWQSSGLSVSSNQTISPDNTLSSDKLIEDNSNSNHQLYSVITSVQSNNVYTLSLFAKKGERDIIQISVGGTSFLEGNVYANFDLANGSIGNGNYLDAKIDMLQNDWYKCSVSLTTISTSNFNISIQPKLTSSSSRNLAYQGDGTSGLYIWGAQLEEQSYPTSYIPTNGATNTRLQDIANNSGNSSLINSTEGVLYAEISALVNSGTDRAISLFEDANNTVSLFYFSAINTIRALILNNGITQAQIDFVLSDATDFNKIAFKYKENDCAFWVNGIEVGTDVTATVPTALNSLNFDYVSNPFYGKNKALVVYKEALTDANLRSLTYPNPVATTFDLDFDTIAEQFTFTRGSEATFVNAQGLIESTESNDAPRIDYSTGAEAFLLEPQSTNLVTQSETFSNWNTEYGKQVVTQGVVISPDGTNNGNKLETSNDLYPHDRKLWTDFSVTVGASYTFSVYIKKVDGELNTGFLHITTGANDTFDVSQSYTATDQWQRVSVTTNSAVSSQIRFLITGDSNSQIYIWGGQVEQQSYATSYIPTDGASATRNQELCKDATPVINSEEGTLYAEISALADDGTIRYLSINDGTNSNRVTFLYYSSSTNIRVIVSSGGTNVMDKNSGVSSLLDFHKVAIKWKENDFAFWLDGVKVKTDTSGLAPIGLNTLSFDGGAGSGNFFGNTKGLKVYPKALADVQLKDLTTI